MAAETVGFRLVIGVARGLSRRRALALGTALARLAFDVFRVRRAVAVRQVTERIAPAGGHREAEAIARESYAVIARTFVDLGRADLHARDGIWDLVRREELAEIERVWKLGRGAVFVSGHFGNWELPLVAVRELGIPVGAMAKDQSNGAVNEYVRAIRLRAGITPISSRRGLREAIGVLRDGGCFATLMDQDAGRKGIFVSFLGRPASTPVGTIAMAVRTGTPVVPGGMIDYGGGKYRLVFAPAWIPPEAGDRDPDDIVREGVEYFTRVLEDLVRAHPENYFWAHRRWKTAPPARGPVQ